MRERIEDGKTRRPKGEEEGGASPVVRSCSVDIVVVVVAVKIS